MNPKFHMRYIKVPTGYQIYYIDDEFELDTITLPEYLLERWDNFINSINDRIPFLLEVEEFLNGLIEN